MGSLPCLSRDSGEGFVKCFVMQHEVKITRSWRLVEDHRNDLFAMLDLSVVFSWLRRGEQVNSYINNRNPPPSEISYALVGKELQGSRSTPERNASYAMVRCVQEGGALGNGLY